MLMCVGLPQLARGMTIFACARTIAGAATGADAAIRPSISGRRRGLPEPATCSSLWVRLICYPIATVRVGGPSMRHSAYLSCDYTNEEYRQPHMQSDFTR